MSLETRFADHVRERRLLAPGDRVVVACSGGADSTALLCLVAATAGELDLGGVVAAHLDHGLRPDSAADARFVQSLAKRLGIACAARRIHVETRAGESPEEASRRARHAFLAEVAEREGATAVLTAHHLDDQAETLLLRILTGTGIAGLAGIPAVRALDVGARPGEGGGADVRIVRPLLPFRREELRAWLRARRQRWREDPTNRAGNVRARLRNEAFPVLASCVGRDPAPLLARLAENAAETSAAGIEEREVARAFLSRPPEGGFVVHRGWARLPAALRREALREPLRVLRGDAQPPSRAEVERLDRLLRGRGVETVRGVRVRTLADGSSAVARRGAEPAPRPLPRLRAEERPAGNAVFLERLRARPGRLEIADAAAVRLPLAVRVPAPGDVFLPVGRERPQRLAHYLQRRGVGADDRARVPLVCDSEGIVWVVGHGLAARAAVTETTSRVLVLSCSSV